MVKVIQVIVTDIKRRGNGRDTAIRRITEYWSLDGEKLAEVDPLPDAGHPGAAHSEKGAK
jgi:hypothetical protein